MWRNEFRDQAQVEDDVKQLRDRDLAATGLWLDRPYASFVSSFDFDPKRYQDVAKMVKAVHDGGLRFALWHAPYVEDAAHPLSDEAKSKGYFPPGTSLGLNSGWGSPIDFTNPAAYAFWEEHLATYTKLGVEGFKLDFGEDIVASLRTGRNVWRFADGSDERTMQHGFPLLYHKAYREAVQATGKTPYLLCRAGRWGDQTNVTVVWPSDMDATLTKFREKFKTDKGEEVTGVGGLPTTVIMGLSLGPSGFPFFASDNAGYIHSPADKETFIRWFEQTALWPAMEVGDASSKMPWERGDQEILDLYRTYARLHLRLFPFFWSHAQRIKTDGRAIARPFGLAFPELGAHPDDQYMLGDELLVAPVMTKGATSRKVLLPPGDWLDWFDGNVYSATNQFAPTSVDVSAPLGKAPLLLRRGAIVPMLRPTIDTLDAVADPTKVDSLATERGTLWARAFAPKNGVASFALYDGGAISLTRTDALAVDYVKKDYPVLYIEIVDVPEPRAADALLRLPDRAALDSAAKGWAWANGTLWVKTDGRVIFGY
jgi:alpha-D-xyloside xylohydrolase